MSLCTVVIPTYNRAQQLKRCLNSLVIQSFKDFNVVVVDDGSTDETNSVCKMFVGILDLLYVFQLNSGSPALPRNIGVSKSTSKYIAFLDSDDFWYENKLQSCIECLEKGYDLVYHDLHYLREDGSFDSRLAPLPSLCPRILSEPITRDLLINGNTIPNSSVVMRRSFFNIVGGVSLDSNLVASEDYDLWIRLSFYTQKFCLVEGIHGCYSFGFQNITCLSRSLVSTEVLMYRYSHLDRLVVPLYAYRLSCMYCSSGFYLKSFRFLLLSIVSNSTFSLRFKHLIHFAYLIYRATLSAFMIASLPPHQAAEW